MNLGFQNSNAYRVFVEELREHLRQAQAVFICNSDPDPKHIYQAGARFHTIKGGAGFFGLAELADIADELEKILHGENFDYCSSKGKVHDLIADLAKLASNLPEPR